MWAVADCESPERLPAGNSDLSDAVGARPNDKFLQFRRGGVKGILEKKAKNTELREPKPRSTDRGLAQLALR